MTLKDIAIFKHFIADKDLRKPFCSTYRQSHNWAKLPTNIEEYFSNVEPLNVIIKAMRICKPNSAFGYDFWQNLHQDWKEFYAKVSSSNFIQNDDNRLERLEGYYSILRENWNDKDKPWRYESITDAQARLGLPQTEPEDYKPNKLEPVVEKEPEEDDGLDFFEIASYKKNGQFKLMADEATINFRSGGYRLTFNQFVTSMIKDYGFTFARLARNKDGEIVIQLNKTFGVNVVIGNRTDSHSGNTTIHSKELCTKLKTLLNIKEDYSILNIVEQSRSDKFINFIISKKQ